MKRRQFLGLLLGLIFVPMMLGQTYTYSLSSDFTTDTIDFDLFEEEINDSAISSAVLQGINGNGDVIDIVFDGALSAGDKTTLDNDTTGPSGGLVGAHPTLSDMGEADRPGVVRAAADPTANDDGVSVGSICINTVSKDVFILVDNTPGAAVWHPINPLANFQRDSSNGESSTTGDEPVDKLSISVPACYCEVMITVFAEAQNDSISGQVHAQLWNGTAGAQLAKLEITPKDGDDWRPVVFFEDVTLTGSNKTIELRFWNEGEGTASLRNAFIISERID